MSEIVLLDSGPLGMLSNTKSSVENDECREWVERLLFETSKSRYPK
jgi:hypothetical protein